VAVPRRLLHNIYMMKLTPNIKHEIGMIIKDPCLTAEEVFYSLLDSGVVEEEYPDWDEEELHYQLYTAIEKLLK
jgi:hypothetical protein